MRKGKATREREVSGGFRLLAAAAAGSTWLLVVLGGVVRITGSGMGCGDDWPLCKGELLPPMDLPTLIEYGHRVAAAAISVLVVGLAVWAWRAWRTGRHAGGAWRSLRSLTAAAVVLLVLQVLLGAVTVWLELPPGSVILHLSAAMALLATLVVIFCRAGVRRAGPPAADGASRLATAVAGLGFAVVLVGALVANLDAAPACQGFPLCNGAWLPADNWRVQVHWAHRMTAYLLVPAVLLLYPAAGRARPGDGPVRATAAAAALLVVAQVGVAAWMVLGGLPTLLRALHVAAGAALFAVLVAHAWLVARPGRAPRPAPRAAAGGRLRVRTGEAGST